jgi:hypothetical protein
MKQLFIQLLIMYGSSYVFRYYIAIFRYDFEVPEVRSNKLFHKPRDCNYCRSQNPINDRI